MLLSMRSKRNTSSLLGGLQSCTNALEINLVFLRKLQINLSQGSAILLLGVYIKDVPTSQKDTYSTMFIAALFVKVKKLKKQKNKTKQNKTKQKNPEIPQLKNQ